jgi:hypothetical protein
MESIITRLPNLKMFMVELGMHNRPCQTQKATSIEPLDQQVSNRGMDPQEKEIQQLKIIELNQQ